jgi:hypothetical protein
MGNRWISDKGCIIMWTASILVAGVLFSVNNFPFIAGKIVDDEKVRASGWTRMKIGSAQQQTSSADSSLNYHHRRHSFTPRSYKMVTYVPANCIKHEASWAFRYEAQVVRILFTLYPCSQRAGKFYCTGHIVRNTTNFRWHVSESVWCWMARLTPQTR